MAAAIQQPLYLVTDGGILRSRNVLVSSITEALEGAAGRIGFVQLREQVIGIQAGPFAAATDPEVLLLVEQLLPLCRVHGAKLVINGRPDLVRSSGADGVHLNVHAGSIAAAKQQLGASAIVGCTAHDPDEAAAAEQQGADYVLCSPVFAPASRRSPRPPLGLAGLRVAAAKVKIPLFAMGGVSPENAADCRSAGASGIAMLTAVLQASNPRAAAAELVNALEKPPL